jgi:hypothetical protein
VVAACSVFSTPLTIPHPVRMPSPPPASQTFILRVWLEPGPGGEAGEWRGEIKSVPGGETAYFRGWDAAAAALRRAVEGTEGNRE